MKKLAMLAMATVFMFGVTLSAQQRSKSSRQNCPGLECNGGQNKMLTPQMRADRMAKQLELSESETAKVKALIEKQDANRIKRMDEMQKVRNEFKAKAEKERNAHDAELEKVIGKEKFQKLTAQRAERLENVKERRGSMDGRKDGRKGQNRMQRENNRISE